MWGETRAPLQGTAAAVALAAGHGSALVDLAVAVRSSPALAALRPQV